MFTRGTPLLMHVQWPSQYVASSSIFQCQHLLNIVPLHQVCMLTSVVGEVILLIEQSRVKHTDRYVRLW